MTFCYNENNEYVLFDSYIDMSQEILFKVPKSSDKFLFDGVLNYNDREKVVLNQDVNICISNTQGLTLKLSKDLFDNIKSALCRDTSKCDKTGDLKNNPEIDFEIKMKDHIRSDNYFKTKFFTKSFYYTLGSDIGWKIDVLNDDEQKSGC